MNARMRSWNWALASVLVVATVLLSREAAAVQSCGGVTTPSQCNNFCYCCHQSDGGSGNCVWYAWHRACTDWGVQLQWCTDAHTWDGYASNNGYTVSATPCESTIFVCEPYTTLCGTGSYGHVGFVEAVYADGSIDVREQGCSMNGVRVRHFAAQNASPTVHYIYRPGVSSCCSCSPGQVETQSCGNCGTQSRTCGGDCHWGGWSDCSGQGACAPGQVQTQPCCDCGTQTRTCTDSCNWNDWSSCDGPDPTNSPQCDTGEFGPCAEGRIRCVGGCLGCVRTYTPSAEVCDAVDNDCSGQVDDGSPDVMGDPPPPFAAQLRDVSAPQFLVPGETGAGWVTFENVGSATWPAHGVGLGSAAALAEQPSQLWDVDEWPAYDLAAVLDGDVAPGEIALFDFTLVAAFGSNQRIAERFVLLDPQGQPIACPGSDFELEILRGDLRRPSDQSSEAGAGDASDGASGGCACRVGTGASGAAGTGLLLWIGAMIVLWRRRSLLV